jgi:hypothetical protein
MMRKISIDHHFRAFSYRSFERTIVLPEGVDPNHVRAKFHNGVLQITLPTSAAMAPKRIEILVHSTPEAECMQFPREALDLLIHGVALAA